MKHSHKSHLSYCTGKGINIFAVLSICMACLVFKGCVPENIAIPNRIVSIATSDVANVTAKGATLSGKVVTNDADTITCGVIYGTESSLTSASGTKQATTAHGDFSIIVTGLDAQTTYYYRAYGIDAGRYKYGEVRSFETKPSISITTSDSVDVTASTATLRGMVSNAEEAMTCGIIYGTSTTLSSTNGIIQSTTSSGAYSISITGLNANTTYYYRAYVLDEGEYKYGEILSFKTKLNISVTTKEAADVTANTASLGGKVDNAESALPCGIIYGTSSTLSATIGTMVSTTSADEYSVSVSGLKENTTYYYRAYVLDDEEYKYGEVLSFKTKLNISVTTKEAADVTANTASLGGKVDNAESALPCGIIYGTSSTLSATIGTMVSTTSADEYSVSVSGLKENTTYYYRAYVLDEGEYKYGEILSFLTKDGVSVMTGDAKEVMANAVTLTGKVVDAEEAMTCGIIYGTSTTLSSIYGIIQSTTSSGDFSVTITKLNENTTYYYRAYVLDNGEYKYGDVRSFTTAISITVTTGAAEDITNNSVTLKGTIMNATKQMVCGMIYGTSSTLSSTSGTKRSTTSSGDFTIWPKGLDENTTYYYRAYVLDNGEYKYGEVRSFTTTTTGIAVTTGNAINITDSKATLNGTVFNAEEELTCGMIFGTSSTLDNGVKKPTVSQGKYFIELTGLSENTTYYYRAYLFDVDDREYKYGEIRSFTTKKSITVTTGDAIDIMANTATVCGTVNNAEEMITCGVIYGISSVLSSTSGTMKSMASKDDFSIGLTGLTNNTTYYYRAYVIVNGEYRYGEVLSFTTKRQVSVRTIGATGVTSNSATLNGEVNYSEQELTCGIIYGTSSTLSSTSGSVMSTTSSGEYSVGLTGLSENTTYYYRAFAIVADEYKYGIVRSFSTEALGEAIDLGLSVKWASHNMGAATPEEDGSYYAWGETEEKDLYGWSNYKWCNGHYFSITKYCTDSSYGTVDNKSTLDSEDDVAHIKWGGGWRIPTVDEMNELIEQCSWQWTTVNEISGCKVTGPNGNSIFLPIDALTIGCYWLNKKTHEDNSCAYFLYFCDGAQSVLAAQRCEGFTVRPVKDY